MGTDTLQAEHGVTFFVPNGISDDVTVEITGVPPSGDHDLFPDVTVARIPELSDVIPEQPMTAMFPPRNVDPLPTPQLMDISPIGGEFTHLNCMDFCTPEFGEVPAISVNQDCIKGTCDCTHYVGDVPAQLKPCRAAQFLFGPDALSSVSEVDRDFLWHGLVNGFKIVDPDCPTSYTCTNYDSITGVEFKGEMSALLQGELSAHKVSSANVPPQCIHALGAVRKSDGLLRPITDCSRPEGASINNFMNSTFESFSYNSVDSAVQILCPANYMSVVDISAAYRSVNVHADHVKFQGFRWDFGQGEEVYRDHRLCFGLRCAPNIFNSLSVFVVKIANHLGASKVVNYLDDFLIIADSEEACMNDRTIVTDVLSLLGFDVSWKKVTAPAQVSVFLGITIDSVTMELSLPSAKVEKLKLCINTLVAKGTASKKELECVGGLVSHCSYVTLSAKSSLILP